MQVLSDVVRLVRAHNVRVVETSQQIDLIAQGFQYAFLLAALVDTAHEEGLASEPERSRKRKRPFQNRASGTPKHSTGDEKDRPGTM